MTELTNTEFAAHLRVAADMMDCEDNDGNPIVPGIVRSMRKASGIIDDLTSQLAALQAENAELRVTLSRVEAERDHYKRKYEELGAEYTKLRTDRAFRRGAQGEG